MTIVVAVAVGFLAARLVWVMFRPVFAHELFQRENYWKHLVPTAGGAVAGVAHPALPVLAQQLVLGHLHVVEPVLHVIPPRDDAR